MAQTPNLLQGPEPVETAELHFKLSCKLKIFETQTKYEGGHCCVLAVSQYYGLIFVGNCNGFSVLKTKTLSPVIDCEKFPKRDVVLNLRPTHISVDFSQKILAVVCNSKSGSVLVFYDIQSFANKDITPLKITEIAKLVQNLAAEVIDLTWQPNSDGSLMICLSDGSVLALSQGAKDGPMFTLPNTTQATCFCWSPKGKQIVIGTAGGLLSQYKPDLKVVKTLPPPPIFNGAAMVVSILWISNYQFAVAYNDRGNPELFPVITIVNATKNEPVNVINYDDITYSNTLFRNHQIYMSHQTSWNLIFVSSANSIEVAVLHSKDTSSWEQWLLGDASRAELPLNPDRQETFPLGWAFDFTSQESIPWGEGSLPPMPRLLLMSDEGILCVFNVVNAAENAPQLCAPPKESLDDSLFVSSMNAAPPPVSEPPKPTQPTKSLLGSPPTFGSLKPTYTFEASPGFVGFGTPRPQTALPQEQQQQPLQLQPQIPQPVLTPQLAPTSTFKLPAPHFGTTPSTFSFDANSGSVLGSKPDMLANTTITKVGVPQPATITLKPSTIAGDIFAGKTPPQSTPVKQPEVEKTVTTPIPTIKKPEVEKTVCTPIPMVKKPEEVEKSEELPQVQGESPGPGTPELAAVDDSVYLIALEEEIEHFNSELQQLSAKVGNFSVDVGSEEDKERMKKSIDGLHEFWKELKETTKAQSGEVHSVVMDLMESFAWLEDAKSRNLQKMNPSYIELKKSEELDPLSARHMNEISHLKYYIENQLKQLISYLEKEWMDHQENYRNEVKGKMAVPPLEEIHKTMHYQLKILYKQKVLVEELKDRIAMKKRKKKMESLPISVTNPVPPQGNADSCCRVSELSKLAENLLQLKIAEHENSPRTATWELMKSLLNAISERSRKLNRAKQAALRDALSEFGMVKIRPVKTTLESSTFLRSLALEKAAQKSAKLKAQAKPKEIEKDLSPVKTNVVDVAKTKLEVKPFQDTEKTKGDKPVSVTKPEIPKSIPMEKPPIPLTVQALAEPEEKSPLASLTGIVSSIGKKPEPKPQMKPFTFGTSPFQKVEPGKDTNVFGSVKLEPKQEKPKITQTFTFAIPKPADSSFGKKEPIIFGAKPAFGVANSTTSVVTTKPDLPKMMSTVPNLTTTAVTSAPAVTPSLVFTFGATTTASSVTLPKMNSVFSGKEQTSGFGVLPASGNLFSISSTAGQISSTSSLFNTEVSVFGNKTTSSFASPAVSLFEVPKTTSDGPTQPSGFTFTQPVENKPANVTVATPVKPTSETEEVDVVKIDEPVKKPELVTEKSKESPKATVPSSIFGSVPAPVKAIPEVTTSSSAPPNVTIVSTTQSSVTVGNIFAKPPGTIAATATTTTTTTTSVESTMSVSVVAKSTTPMTATTFSFSKAMAPISFGQTATTTTATTTTSLFETPTITTSIIGQVSSTTPTTSIFGGSTTTPPTTSIFDGSNSTTSASIAFGGGTPTKPIFPQASTPTTTSENIFGASTPTTNAFGQETTPATTPTGFGQKPDNVSQATNLFGQLLSDNSRSVFGNAASTQNSGGKLFSSNIFGGGASTTTSSSIFPQTTSIFGQPTTSSNVFGQSQTSPSNSFFGQSICSPFGGGTSVTSNQSTFDSGGFNKSKFGERAFGQATNTSSLFGGSPSSTLFGGASNTTAGNVFQTPTTSTTFGSATPGPFSGGASSFGDNSFASTANSFQKPLGGFGSPPVFGGSPAFGGSPTFGGSPSFSSSHTFGSMTQVSGNFGQSAGSTTFENLANQNTVGFGNLAQQSQNQGFRSSFGSSSFENKSAYGGNSFSNWRSK